MPIKEFIWFYIKSGVQLNRLNWSRLDFLSHRNFWTCGTLIRHKCWTGIPMERLQLTPKMVLWLRYSNSCFILVERNQCTMSTIQVVWEARIGKSAAIISMDLVCQWLSIPLLTTPSVNLSATFPVLSRSCFHSSMRRSLTGLTRKPFLRVSSQFYAGHIELQ